MGLINIPSDLTLFTKAILFPKTTTIIVPVTEVPNIESTFRKIADYFSPCFNESDKTESCGLGYFERDDILPISIHEWYSSKETRNRFYRYIHPPDAVIMDNMSLFYRFYFPLSKNPSPVEHSPKRLVLNSFPRRIEPTTEILTDDRNRIYNQVGLIPFAFDKDGGIKVLLTQETYENNPWSFFSGKPLTRNDNYRLRRGQTVEIDYYKAAIREYEEESMGILEILEEPTRERFLIGENKLSKKNALWPIQVRYDDNIGEIYRRVYNYTQKSLCITKGKLIGRCRESHMEKQNAQWLSLQDAIIAVNNKNPMIPITAGIRFFVESYREILNMLQKITDRN
jgi:hypothetical protein